MIDIAIKIVAIGVVATAVMDIVSLTLKRLRLVDSPDYSLVGRWIGHMFMTRTFAHRNMTRATKVPSEMKIGWLAHYAIGIMFAGALVAVVGKQWLHNPTIAPALLFGLVTVAFPLFVMQPAFGLGIAARLSSNPPKALLRSLLNHLSLGLGLYLGGLFSTVI